MLNEESLFEAALEKPTASERRAFLEDACADVRLRKRVELLLAAHDNIVAFWTLRQGRRMDGGRRRINPRWWFTSVRTRRHHDRRPLQAARGNRRGGMGTVWKAEQKQPVRRTVALKLIRAGMDSRSVLSRFEAERQALALMDHPTSPRCWTAARPTAVGRSSSWNTSRASP